ncbi:MAG: hypothetical protein H6707_21685 [Deltaproteobacteria bacterium]|nr:hypothetical protein [Deltaproteobacteria bacterium]
MPTRDSWRCDCTLDGNHTAVALCIDNSCLSNAKVEVGFNASTSSGSATVSCPKAGQLVTHVGCSKGTVLMVG